MKIFLVILVISALARSNPAPQLSGSDLDNASDTILKEKIQTTPFHLSPGMLEFANKMYQTITEGENGNMVISPFSLHTALSMTYFGSPEASETHRELTELLGLPKQFQTEYPTNYLQLLSRYDNLRKINGATVQFANKIYTNKGFEAKEDFLSLLTLFYRTTQEELNFSDAVGSADAINRFVSAKTNGLINELITSGDIDGLTRMILVNAIYFKADWFTQFDPKETEPRDWELGTEKFPHPTMSVEGEFGTSAVDDYYVLEMPYVDRNISMLVFLPKTSSSIQDLDAAVNKIDLANVYRNMVYGRTDVRFPKMDVEAKQEMVPILRKLGVNSLFDPEKADLSDITEEEKIAVSKIVHQAKLKVTEEGSEAAAATAVAIGTRTVGMANPQPFYVNRPFMFIIHDRVFNIPLFMGRIVDPSGQRSLPPKVAGFEASEERPFGAAPTIPEQAQPVERLGINSNQQEITQDLPDCSEVGYSVVQNPHISFPCRGQETMPVREHEARQREELAQRRARFLRNGD